MLKKFGATQTRQSDLLNAKLAMREARGGGWGGRGWAPGERRRQLGDLGWGERSPRPRRCAGPARTTPKQTHSA